MLTPQQIQEISFEKALFGGYDMESVDEILEPLTQDYLTLYKENSVLKSKMRILVERLEEYRKQEASMQSAILAAQRTCEQMRVESERKCAQMLREAELAAAEKQHNAMQQSSVEEERLKVAKASMSQFLNSMEKRLKRQLELIDELRNEELADAPASAESETVHQFTQPRETFTEAPQPRESGKRAAFDFESERANASAQEDALVKEIGQKIEASLGGATIADLANQSEPTRKIDELHGVFSPQKQKIFDELNFGRKNEPTTRK